MDPITKRIIVIVVVACISAIIKSVWQSQKKQITFDDNKSDNTNDINHIDIDGDTPSDKTSNIDIIEIIKRLINQKKFILVESRINNELFEFIIKNYDFEHFKRLPTYIIINGNLSTAEFEYSSWSYRYQLDQHEHNQSVVDSFISELNLTISNNGVNPIDEIKKQIGPSAHYRWKQLAQKMMNDGEKSKEEVINELVKYGLSKELAINIIDQLSLTDEMTK